MISITIQKQPVNPHHKSKERLLIATLDTALKTYDRCNRLLHAIDGDKEKTEVSKANNTLLLVIYQLTSIFLYEDETSSNIVDFQSAKIRLRPSDKNK